MSGRECEIYIYRYCMADMSISFYNRPQVSFLIVYNQVYNQIISFTAVHELLSIDRITTMFYCMVQRS